MDVDDIMALRAQGCITAFRAEAINLILSPRGKEEFPGESRKKLKQYTDALLHNMVRRLADNKES